MTTMAVLDATGATVNIEKPLTPGRAAAAASRPVVSCSEDAAAIAALATAAQIGEVAATPTANTVLDRLKAIATALATNHTDEAQLHTDIATTLHNDLAALEALLPAAFAGNGGLKVGAPDIRPVSGNITVIDSASSTATGQNSVSVVTGAPTANSFQSQAINGQSAARIQISGTWTGTLTFEGSPDGGTTWIQQTARVTGTVFTQASVTANGTFSVDVAGLTNLRVRATAAMTGTAVVQMAFASAPGFVQVTNPLRLVDNSSGAQATIKAASTAPATTDTAIVVSPFVPTSTGRMASAAATTNATNVKTSAGRVFQISGKNNAAYDVFLVLYDAVTNPPVPGTTTIRKKMICPAGQAFVYDAPDAGMSFASGIGYAFTKLVADADTTALASGDITAFNLDYA